MHKALFDDHFLEGTHATTLHFVKAMIDEGYLDNSCCVYKYTPLAGD